MASSGCILLDQNKSDSNLLVFNQILQSHNSFGSCFNLLAKVKRERERERESISIMKTPR